LATIAASETAANLAAVLETEATGFDDDDYDDGAAPFDVLEIEREDLNQLARSFPSVPAVLATFAQGRMVCVMPEGHELASADSITFSDLSRVPLITHNPSIQFGKIIESSFAQAGFTPAPRIYVLQTEIACSLVRAGAGLAIVDEYTAAGGPWSGLVVKPLAHEIALAPSIARTVFERHGTHADKFIEILSHSI
jgi:DNA-binding transcriptional LysR family regulator